MRISAQLAHPQKADLHAVPQDKYHLYFLFDLMNGGDLMDVLVSEAQVVKMRIAQGALKRGCFAPQVRCAGLPFRRGCRTMRCAAAASCLWGMHASALVFAWYG